MDDSDTCWEYLASETPPRASQTNVPKIFVMPAYAYLVSYLFLADDISMAYCNRLRCRLEYIGDAVLRFVVTIDKT
jgi:hypothetical protein